MNLRFSMKNSQTKHYIETKQRRVTVLRKNCLYECTVGAHLCVGTCVCTYAHVHVCAREGQ